MGMNRLSEPSGLCALVSPEKNLVLAGLEIICCGIAQMCTVTDCRVSEG